MGSLTTQSAGAMAAAEYYSGPCMNTGSLQSLAPQMLQRVQTEQTGMKREDAGIAQGRIMWLPAMEDLPERAVRRAHGKGAVEEGIYNHPVVVVSRPLDDERCVHFHLITSLQGKRLDQLYPKANEFHTSRRSWYLPISPSPDHPDATSKKAKKRFPTLALADGTSLRWDSYVNIRHVYKTDWAFLKPYSNLNKPDVTFFQFDRESVVRMVAKGKVLTLYEPGEQVAVPGLRTRHTAPPCLLTPTDSNSNSNSNSNLTPYRDGCDMGSPGTECGTVAPPSATSTPIAYGSGFRTLSGDGARRTKTLPGEPPDPKTEQSLIVRLFGSLFLHRRER
ncbi:hypothetical protein E8E13_010299 [Curvularia kusanoi]|uniref:Uncharacterized protein n=1 Tax=Curvularia kusanoi TaxID=90978 RepID=A0A9P4TKF8_CURKU|nr:hypothetical protein E8E13_010299 [Curvularia kusanoi]